MKNTHTMIRRSLLTLLAALCLCVADAAQTPRENAKKSPKEFKPTREQTAEAARLRGALEASVKNYPPVITMLPFDVDASQDFNEWLVGFLTPRAMMRPTKRGR